MTLQEARVSAGLHQNELHRRSGVFQTKISREESGERCLRLDERLALEEALGLPDGIDWGEPSPVELTPKEEARFLTLFNTLAEARGAFEVVRIVGRQRSPKSALEALERTTAFLRGRAKAEASIAASYRRAQARVEEALARIEAAADQQKEVLS